MNILYLANLIPFPLDGGGKIFTYSTIQALSKNNTIDLVCFYEQDNVDDGIKALDMFCSSVTVLPIKVTTRENMSLMMRKAAFSLFSAKPLGISKYITREMKDVIKRKIAEKKYDVAFFNILAMYGYASYIRKLDKFIRLVLYEQNCETLIYKRLYNQTNDILKKCFLKIETTKLKQFEQYAVTSVDRLIVLSDEDRKALGVVQNRCTVIPIGVNDSNYKKKYERGLKEKIKLLFVGTMTWTPNNEGIIWFLENVMPMCSDSSKYELYIVGKNPSERVQLLSERYEGVHLLGYVESLIELYDQCDVLIVPLFIGSGQRVKIIEAFEKKYPVISTSIGAEGLKYIDGESILIADNEETFYKQIEKCFNTDLLDKIGSGGYKVFTEEYSTQVIMEKLNKVLEN